MNSYKKRWIAFALCFISYLFAGTASTLIASYLPVIVKELTGGKADKDLGETGAYFNALFLYGWMTGGLIFGVLTDRIGRKKLLVFCTLLYGLTILALIVVKSLTLLLICRFATGMGVGGVLLVSTVYIAEVWPQKNRAVILGILAIAFPVGIVASGALTIRFADWRQACWLGMVPLTTTLAMMVALDETQEWHTQRMAGKVKMSEIFAPGNRVNLRTASLIFGAVLIGLWGIFSWMPAWVQTILPGGATGEKERGLTMMLLGTGGIAGGVFSGLFINAIGNRNTLCVCFTGMILSCLLLFTTNPAFSNYVYAETALLAIFFGISQGALSSFIPALFPTAIRATATGFSFNIGRLFTATAVFFIGALVSWLGGFANALLCFSLLFLVALIVAFRFHPLKTN